MSKLVDGNRFRGGIEVKTPTETRKIKADIKAADTLSGLLHHVGILIDAPAYSHRVPKSFDKETGEPKKYVWKIQPDTVKEVSLLNSSAYFSPTCVASAELVSQLTEWLDGEQKVLTNEAGDNLLVSPLFDRRAQGVYSPQRIIGVKITKVGFTPIADL